jgi:hypothetical protein
MTMPRLALNRKDTGGESIGGKGPGVHFSPQPLKRFHCGGIVAGSAK